MAGNRKEEIEARIALIEAEMAGATFWSDKQKAQATVKEYQDLKTALLGGSKYDAGDAVVTIFSGAGGDDAEDFSSILFRMYQKFADLRGFGFSIIHMNENDHGGYRNITFEILGKNAYAILKNESGVHRLVRISPFNSKKLRHTSFSLVEVIPKFEKSDLEIEIPESELEISFARSSGPGGQNVNKRETAVRIVHTPTGLAVHADNERTQEANRDRAMALLKGKLFKLRDANQKSEKEGMYISKTTDIEWGNQIRSYVLHPYKMVKDHRTEVETSDVDAVLDGEIDVFIEAEQGL